MRSLRSIALVSICVPLTVSLCAPLCRADVQVVSATHSDPGTDTSLEKRRVLHLQSGQSIRVVSRFVDDRWEYKNKSGWKTLDPGAVTSAQLESELLAQWSTKRAALDTKNCDERAKLAAWGVTAGLTAEALTELDATLAQSPDHAGALEVLRSHWFFSVPSIQVDADKLKGAEDELLRFGAAQTTCGRELAALELARDADKPALKTRLITELGSSIVARRAFASLALRRVFPGEDVKPLMVHAVLDASAEVRQGCALALKAANDPAVCVPIVRALQSKSIYVRANAAEALGNMAYTAAVEPLMATLAAAQSSGSSGDRLPHSNIFVGRQFAYIQDFDVEVAQFQAVADPQVNVLIEGSTMDTAVSGVQVTEYATLSTAIQGSLAKLTSEMPGHSANAWLAWWTKNSEKWRAEDRSRPKTG